MVLIPHVTADWLDADHVTTGVIDHVTVTGSAPGREQVWMAALEGLVVVVVSSGIILTNLVNLAVLARMRQIPWAMRVFLLNLSASDLLVGVVACAPASYCAFTSRWPYGAIWCQISGVTHGTSVTISIWSISMVGIDRYIAACHPHKYQRSAFTKHCAVIVVVMWLLAFVTFLVPVFTKADLTYYQYDDAYKMCGLYWEYPAFCVITGIYIPVLSGSVLLFTTLRTNHVLRKKAATKEAKRAAAKREIALACPRLEVNGVKAKPPRSRVSMNEKAMKILALTSIAYFACWGPYVSLVFAQSFVRSLRVPAWLNFTTLWLANANSMLNVVIYSGTNRSFRQTAVGIYRGIRAGTPCVYKQETGSLLAEPDLSFTGMSCSQMPPAAVLQAHSKDNRDAMACNDEPDDEISDCQKP